MATLANNLTESLVQAIVAGDIHAGSKISEPELARQFGVGRGSLREALLRVEGLGLIERSPNLGARVVGLGLDEILDIYTTREALEGMACRLAAERMSNHEVDELQRLLDSHAAHLKRVDGSQYLQQEGDFDFHYRIIQASGNHKLIGLLCGELYYLVRMFRQQTSNIASRPEQALREHQQILDALRHHDGELAELLMRRHIARAAQSIVKHMNPDKELSS